VKYLENHRVDRRRRRRAPRPPPPPPLAAPAALAAAPGRAAATLSTPAAAQSPSGAVQAPAAAGQRGPEVIVGVPPPGLPLPSAGVHVLEPSAGRFGIESADGRNAIFLTGRLHFDVGDYLDYTPASRFAAVQDLNSGANARRARIGVIARFMRDWELQHHL